MAILTLKVSWKKALPLPLLLIAMLQICYNYLSCNYKMVFFMQRVLLIEDNDEIRENTAEILELANYIVDTASNGKLGVEMALDCKPDLIICDVMMPVLDGYGVLHLMQKNETLKNIPFIFLTAKAERGDFRKGMEMGADDYITKPFSDIELLTAIESRLLKARIQSERAESTKN